MDDYMLPGNPGALRQVVSRGRIVEIVAGHLGKLLRLDVPVGNAHVSLIELGAESLDFLELVFRLERTFSIKLPKQLAVPDVYCVGDYVTAVEQALGGDVDVTA